MLKILRVVKRFLVLSWKLGSLGLKKKEAGIAIKSEKGGGWDSHLVYESDLSSLLSFINCNFSVIFT